MSSRAFVGLHPDNPHYFLYRDKPLILITSTEHYGAVINLDFDYIAYLDMLKEKGFRLTRVFTFYREQTGTLDLETPDPFNFYELGRQNTLAPSAGSYAAPWMRTTEPGCMDGGSKFDLTEWNEAYFDRLKEFCKAAGYRGILVEVTLFSQYYSDSNDGPWKVSPLHAANNINGIGAIPFDEFLCLKHRDIVDVQEALVRRIVNELRDCDNIYYEICNEPHPRNFGNPEVELAPIAAWQNHWVSLIFNLESAFPERHMIAVCDFDEHHDMDGVSIFNYHYSDFVDTGLKQYYDTNRLIAFDETLSGILSWNRAMDFDGLRKEAWEYILRGCAVYNYLDLTVATDDPSGSGKAVFPLDQHYNGETMRLYLKHLNDFIHRFNFIGMRPDNTVIKGQYLAAAVLAFVEKGKSYAVYFNGSSLKFVTIELPEGRYDAEWFNPRNGRIDGVERGIYGGRDVRLEIPLYEQDIALRITRV